MESREAENKGIGQDLFETIRNAWDSQSCHQAMGFRITYLGDKSAGIEMIPNSEFSTGGGRLHGGVIATLVDAVMGAAAATQGHLYRTAEMKVNYMAPAFEESVLIAEGRVIHPGKTLAVVEGSLYNPQGKLVAKGIGTYFRDIKMPPPERVEEM